MEVVPGMFRNKQWVSTPPQHDEASDENAAFRPYMEDGHQVLRNLQHLEFIFADLQGLDDWED